MTVYYLRKLVSHLALRVPQPPTEVNLLRTLAHHALGDACTEDKFREILAKRLKLHEAQSGFPSLFIVSINVSKISAMPCKWHRSGSGAK